MSLRALVLIVAATGIPLALLVLALPMTWGYGGYNWDLTGPASAKVVYLDPHGPAAKAGLRLGDEVIPSKGVAFIYEQAAPAGTVIPERVVRDGAVRTIAVRFETYSGDLATQEQISKWLSALVAIGAFVVAALVTLRARDRRVGAVAALVLVLAGLNSLCGAFAQVCGNVWIAFICYDLLPPFLGTATACAGLFLLSVYPPGTQFRNAYRWTGLSILLVGLAFAGYTNLALLYSLPVSALLNSSDFYTGFSAVISFVEVLAVIAAMVTVPAAYRTSIRWLGASWLLALACFFVPVVLRLIHGPLGIHGQDIFSAFNVLFLAFGVAYPILRHRLVDLNFFVSRATIFAAVSAVIVTIFIVAEWAIGKIFERSFGLSNDRGGLFPDLITLAIVLGLGISARSIHSFIDDRLTGIFFRDRALALAEIERTARETDAATDESAVMDIAADTAARCLRAHGVAIYLRDGDGYRRVRLSGSVDVPEFVSYNNQLAIRLRRWLEPFEADVAADHTLFVPMTLRGDVIGFFCCGPKPDRTLYQSDEIAAISLLAHHAGIAHTMLGRQTSIPLHLATQA